MLQYLPHKSFILCIHTHFLKPVFVLVGTDESFLQVEIKVLHDSEHKALLIRF